MNKRFFGLSALLILLAITAASFAAAPRLINYQGYLTNPSGAALDTTVGMVFKFYDGPSAGANVLWTENWGSVAVQSGLFNAVLGSFTAIPGNIFNQNYVWLGITVGSNAEMTPRARVATVGYAQRVASVDSAGGGTITGMTNILNGATIGNNNYLIGTNTFAVGNYDTVFGGSSTVAGGYGNSCRGTLSFIGGGTFCRADSGLSAICGGQYSHASGSYSFIGGGYANLVDSMGSVIGGGHANRAAGDFSFIGSGYGNWTQGSLSAVGGGDSNYCWGSQSFIGGGVRNVLLGTANTIGGGSNNSVTNSSGTIGGGFYNYSSNQYAAILGGVGNRASEYCSTVGGGDDNAANGQFSVVSGGYYNTASGNYSGCLGGYENMAVGVTSAVIGGDYNRANGTNTIACGHGAKANGYGCFAWADEAADSFAVGLNNTFNVRATGGTRFFSNSTSTLGAQLPANATAWVAICDSTKKERYGVVDTKTVLDKVTRIPIQTWSYKADPNHVRHMGPMAQDMFAAFHLGESDTTISTLDPDGVSLAAIQELAKEVAELRAENSELRSAVQSLQADNKQSSLVVRAKPR